MQGCILQRRRLMVPLLVALLPYEPVCPTVSPLVDRMVTRVGQCPKRAKSYTSMLLTRANVQKVMTPVLRFSPPMLRLRIFYLCKYKAFSIHEEIWFCFLDYIQPPPSLNPSLSTSVHRAYLSPRLVIIKVCIMYMVDPNQCMFFPRTRVGSASQRYPLPPPSPPPTAGVPSLHRPPEPTWPSWTSSRYRPASRSARSTATLAMPLVRSRRPTSLWSN